jgi:hypothetical protein
MPNPTPAKYTVQIGPTYTVETAAELTGWAVLQGRSVSEVTRQATERGLELLRQEWRTAHGVIPHSVLERATEEVRDRGDRQAARKRKVAARPRPAADAAA